MPGIRRRAKHSDTDPARLAEWTDKHESIAMDVALGELSYVEIAAKYGIGRSTLWRWLKNDSFQEQIAELTASLVEETDRGGLFSRVQRKLEMQREWDALKRVLRERAEKFVDKSFLLAQFGTAFEPHPAAATGLYEVGVRETGTGRLLAEWGYDDKLLGRLKALREEAARMQLEPGFVPASHLVKAGDGDDDRALDEGTRHTMTDLDRARALLAALGPDPDEAKRLLGLLALMDSV